jgi:hypothetical protein
VQTPELHNTPHTFFPKKLKFAVCFTNSAAFASLNVTNPYPFDLPVTLSMIILHSNTWPWVEKKFSSWASSACMNKNATNAQNQQASNIKMQHLTKKTRNTQEQQPSTGYYAMLICVCKEGEKRERKCMPSMIYHPQTLCVLQGPPSYEQPPTQQGI